MSNFSFEAPDPSSLNELIDGYEVTALIEEGGMGAVYRATQTALNREVAIKLLPKELGDSSFRDQFEAEAQAMAQLNHVNLIGIYDFGEVEGMPYIVMEYVHGKSLYYSTYETAIDQDTTVALIIAICEGLAHAHEAGIIHRDIKPANILLDPKATPKISDFGLASAQGHGNAHEDVVFGTPGYAAPEIVHGGHEIGRPADLYAVGVILYQMLTGKMPEADSPPPSQTSACDPRLDQIYLKATLPSPEHRYQTAEEFIADLQAIYAIPQPSVQPLVTAPPTAAAPVLQPATSPLPPQPTSKAPKKSGKSGSGSVVRNLLIIAALIPVLFFAWNTLQNKEDALKAQQEADALAAAERAAALEAERLARIEAQEKARLELLKQQEADRLAAAAATPAVQRLEKFREAAINAAEGAFPPEAIQQEESYLHFFREPMTWHQASALASNYGGHLVTLASTEEVSFLAEKFDSQTETVWVGGGSAGKESWAWVTGEPFALEMGKPTPGSCLALGKSGELAPTASAAKHPFFIEWQKDGTTPGSLANQLERLRATLDSENPNWPPSTLASDNRHYLILGVEVAQEKATEIAKSYLGHLAAISNLDESHFLTETLTTALAEETAVWLAGQNQDGLWGWKTEEPWVLANWGTDAPDGGPDDVALTFARSRNGWDDRNPKRGEAQGFLIEWSSDEQEAIASGTSKSDPNQEVRKLRSRAKALVSQRMKEYEKQRDKYRDQVVWNLNNWYKGNSKRQRDQYKGSFDLLTSQLQSSSDFSTEYDFGSLPAGARDIVAKGMDFQVSTERKLDQGMEKLRQAYLEKIEAMQQKLQGSGLRGLLKKLENEIENIGQNGTSFRQYFL